MSNPGAPNDPSPNSTRQMLDELDALMERMRALPVNDLADQAPAVSPPPSSAKVTVVEASPPVEAPRPTSASSTGPGKVLVSRLSAPPSYTTEMEEEKPRPKKKDKEPKPSSEQIMEKQASLWTEPLPTPDEILPPLVVKPVPAEVKRFPGKRRSLSGIALLPLLWINQAYDRATVVLGPVGRWLRGVHGRKLLGLIGLGLLALAVLWLLHDWLGWNWMADPLE